MLLLVEVFFLSFTELVIFGIEYIGINYVVIDILFSLSVMQSTELVRGNVVTSDHNPPPPTKSDLLMENLTKCGL